MVQVDARFNFNTTNNSSNIENLLRELKRLMQREKTLQSVKEHRFYLKPSARRKQKQKKASTQRRQLNSQRRQFS
ncbi:MAG: 30S ribosomal protein S21 [Candidatus Midichloria sp.]